MGEAAGAFFHREGEVFVASESTCGPWHAGFQHAGPPIALLMHELERLAGDAQIVRMSTDLLRPVPVSRLVVDVREAVGGKRRRILVAELREVGKEQAVARASALVLRREPIATGPLPVLDAFVPRPPESATAYAFDFFVTEVGYHTAMELRLESGGGHTGRTRMWMRQRVPLIAGEEVSPLQRLMAVADSGNGISMVLDTKKYAFTNPDLTVNISRPPRGEWLCLDAITHFQDFGVGMAESRIWDESGVIANATQNLLLELR